MIKVTSSILAFFMLSSLALANDNTPIYDNAYAVKTKEVMMLSQLMNDGHPLNIDLTGYVDGNRGFISSLFENNDPQWEGFADIDVRVNNCFSEENVKSYEKAGVVFKSRIADGTIVAYREAIKQFKKNGAKYVFVDAQTSDNSPHTDKPFAEYFQSLLTEEYLLNEDKRGVSKTTNKLLDVWQTMDARCFQDNSFKASDIFWMAGQVAALAIGVKGASVGNTNMTSLAAHSSNAVDNTANLSNSNGSSVDAKMVSGIATRISVSLRASMVADHYPYSGYSFPISEVEEHLAHYKVIPYNVKKITSK
jgi:hypothetical protein